MNSMIQEVDHFWSNGPFTIGMMGGHKGCDVIERTGFFVVGIVDYFQI